MTKEQKQILKNMDLAIEIVLVEDIELLKELAKT